MDDLVPQKKPVRIRAACFFDGPNTPLIFQPMKKGQERDTDPSIELNPLRLNPILRKKMPREGVSDNRMSDDMDEHAKAALALPGRHFIGLESKVRDKMRQNEPPENLHY